jgi:uncharacterized protein (DUF488 family)
MREDELMTGGPIATFSIGHSNHTFEHFASLLGEHGVDCVVDVRSNPWSRYAPQFNREALEPALASRGIEYVFFGAELGGRPDGDEFYDEEGHVAYGALASTSSFKCGIDALEVRASVRRVAIMCSEEDPTDCHRRLLVARVLLARGVSVSHIRGDGRVQTEADLEPAAAQQSLFDEEKPWRSTRSVLHRRPRATSSTG